MQLLGGVVAAISAALACFALTVVWSGIGHFLRAWRDAWSVRVWHLSWILCWVTVSVFLLAFSAVGLSWLLEERTMQDQAGRFAGWSLLAVVVTSFFCLWLVRRLPPDRVC